MVRLGFRFPPEQLPAPYAEYLEGVLSQALQLPVSTVDNTPLTTRLTTAVVIPSAGNVLMGTSVVLDAKVSDNIAIRNVQFVLTGGRYNKSVIGRATATLAGFILVWNSKSVSNGTYTLQSRATDETGNTRYSRGHSVTIRN
ncbi:MAG: hypothetical protein IVW52_08030 [Acidimicrobiales bacterium]|nr:hypothetical protein [Acidimicrobiales bacterium]